MVIQMGDTQYNIDVNMTKGAWPKMIDLPPTYILRWERGGGLANN